MLTILVPCRPSDIIPLEKDVEILKKHIGNKYPNGLEIVGPVEDFLDPKIVEATIKNLSQFSSENLVFSIHAPFGDRRVGNSIAPSPFNLAFPRKLFYEAMDATAELADEIKAEIINLHASTQLSYRQRNLIQRQGTLGERRIIILDKVRVNLVKIKEKFSQKICLENMPPAWSSKFETAPKTIFYENCFVRMNDFIAVVDPKKNIFATVDTSHLAGSLDSSQLLEEIKSLGPCLGHVHFNDIGTRYQPFFTPFEDGLIPGDGGIGEKVFKELLQYFVEYSKIQDLSINIEVRSRDYCRPVELEKSVKRFMEWLEEINSAG